MVGGNFFYSAKPLGVIEGIDFGYTGEVRKVEAEQISKRLDQGDVVLLTTLGYSASGQVRPRGLSPRLQWVDVGLDIRSSAASHTAHALCLSARQVFNVVSEQLAAETAAALCASKLIFITGGQTLVDTRTKNVIQSMRVRGGTVKQHGGVVWGLMSSSCVQLKDAKNLLSHHCITLYPATVTDECRIEGKPILSEIRASAGNHLISMLRYYHQQQEPEHISDTSEPHMLTLFGCGVLVRFCRYSVQALSKGVRRAHLVAPGNGRLLQVRHTRSHTSQPRSATHF